MIKELFNPFAVQTPDGISAEDVKSLWVDVFTDFYNVPKIGNVFLNGPRGSGKSMMFRYMQPDCQCLVRNVPLKELEYFAVYIPIKVTDPRLTELERLEDKHGSVFVNEHSLVTIIAARTFEAFEKVQLKDKSKESRQALRRFYLEDWSKLLKRTGWTEPLPDLSKNEDIKNILGKMRDTCDDLYGSLISYVRKIALEPEFVSYSGPLCSFYDFLLPLMRNLRNLPFMPSGPIFLMIDDADFLNDTQTRILNTWVSYRSGIDVSLKISTQLSYKNFLTLSGSRIDFPHDYTDVNISTVYTSAKNKYKQRLAEIIRRRLDTYSISATPESFFPQNEKQEIAIREIEKELVEKYPDEGRGFRARDDVTRYARPLYIARLKKGQKKSGHTYSYAGFEQQVHISDGIIRYFLEAASQMYGEMRAKNPKKQVLSIDPSTQDRVVRDLADKYLFDEFAKLEHDYKAKKIPTDTVTKLRNLVTALGAMFHNQLISDQSERRVFSIAFSDSPDEAAKEVLDLGVQYGYFHESSIGRKDGLGRTSLYVLSRRLAPCFLLDPTSFAGYKFVTNKVITDAMHRPNSFINKARQGGINKMFEEPPQLSLFQEE